MITFDELQEQAKQKAALAQEKLQANTEGEELPTRADYVARCIKDRENILSAVESSIVSAKDSGKNLFCYPVLLSTSPYPDALAVLITAWLNEYGYPVTIASVGGPRYRGQDIKGIYDCQVCITIA